MKLRIVALGSRMPAWVATGYNEYAKRMPRDYALELIELKPQPRAGGQSVAPLLAAEAQRIRHACGSATTVALDERGLAWTTRQLAGQLQRWHDTTTDVAFVIGSADGIDPSIRESAAAVVALSALTLPHGMVRVILAEQLYRAASIIGGHPYHRD